MAATAASMSRPVTGSSPACPLTAGSSASSGANRLLTCLVVSKTDVTGAITHRAAIPRTSTWTPGAGTSSTQSAATGMLSLARKNALLVTTTTKRTPTSSRTANDAVAPAARSSSQLTSGPAKTAALTARTSIAWLATISSSAKAAGESARSARPAGSRRLPPEGSTSSAHPART